MEYVNFGRCGLKVSRLCMGTMTFGDQADKDESVRMVKRALDAGINFFDTADMYQDGVSEAILGEALAGKRDDVVVATKVWFPTSERPNDRGLSRRHIVRAVENSLSRLKMDYVDLYQFHAPDYTTPLDESMATMDQLVREGKVRYVGSSNFAAWQMCQALWIADKRGLAPVVSAQIMYNLLARGVEGECLPFCREHGLATMIYNPLAGGLLTGKHKKGEKPLEGTRFDKKEMYRDRYWHDRLFEATEALKGIAEKYGLGMVELSLKWTLAQPGVTVLILGASSLEQLEQNIESCEGELPESVADDFDAVWEELRGPIPKYNR